MGGSSLPPSLIPLLYAAPRDSSSDPDPKDSELHPSFSYPFIPDRRQLPPVLPENPNYRSLDPSSNIRGSPYSNQPLFTSSHPRLPRLPSLSDLNPPWGEGEAGPSSRMHRNYDSGQYRRGSSQPARVMSLPNPAFGYGSASREPRQDAGYYSRFSHQSARNSPIPSLPPFLSFEPSPPFDRRDPYPYPQVGSLSISGSSPPINLRQASSELDPSHDSEYHIGANEEDDGHKDKKRRADSMNVDDNPKKSRKTAVACNFCRGRKLRCNGAKPSCYNCTVRKFECEYVSTQRRRGPGKAPKGSRSRKGRSEHSGSGSIMLCDPQETTFHDSDVSGPIQGLLVFDPNDPDTFPPSPSDSHGAQQFSGSQTSRRNWPEERSDAKDIRRNQPGS